MPDEVTVDLVVVGGGLAGHVAALAAAEGGLEVLLIEKTQDFGGSSALAGGGLAFAGTELQGAAGVVDSADALREDLVRAGRGLGDPMTVEAYVTNQQQTFEWLTGLGVEFSLAMTKPPRRLHALPTGGLIEFLHARVLECDAIDYRPGVEAGRLVTADGRVVGVVVHSDGEEWSVPAPSGVVLASGGFARSAALVAELAPQCVDAVPMGGLGSDGDGIRMARACGAGLVDLEHVEASFGASARTSGPPRLLYAQSDGAIIVNREGRRFVDEGSDIKALGRATATQTGGMAFQILDASVMATSRPVPSTRDFAAAEQAGLLVSAPTVAALAELLDIPARPLEQTLAEYHATGAGGDERPALRTPPYYGYPCRAGLTSTYGGLRVNGEMQVLTDDGAAIPGLYAAGEVVGGLHGGGYLVGTALGKAAVFGLISGRSAATDCARFAGAIPVREGAGR